MEDSEPTMHPGAVTVERVQQVIGPAHRLERLTGEAPLRK